VYLAAGHPGPEVPLYRLDLSKGCIDTAIAEKRVLAIASNGHRVVAAEGNPQGSFVRLLSNSNQLLPLPPDDANVEGHTPSISPDGKTVAFIRYLGGVHYEVMVRSLETGRMQVAYRGRGDLGDPQWLPDGRTMAVIEGAGPKSHVVEFVPGGEGHTVMPHAHGATLHVSAQGMLATTDLHTGTWITDPSSGKTRYLKGWFGIGWIGGDDTLMVADETRLGFVSGPDYSTPVKVQTSPVGRPYEAAWVDG
jgi:hypothetical protein